MFKNILLAFDGSTHARQAAQMAGNLARQGQGLVRVVSVVEPLSVDLGEPNFSRIATERTRSGQRLLEEAARLIGEQVEVHLELLFGPASQEILQVAEIRGCDLIVMGSRGLTGLQALVVGSHTQKVISQAACPVLVVR